jgi:hypothetical protein
MLEIAIALIIGFALEYGVREWISRQRHQAERRREPAITPAPNRGKNRGCSAETGNSGLAQDCVVGLGGLEPATRRLSAPSRQVPNPAPTNTAWKMVAERTGILLRTER